MKKNRSENVRKSINKIVAVVIFGIGFGLVEAMVVIYLRQILITSSHDFFSNANYFMQSGVKAQLLSLGFIVFLRPEVLAFWDTLHLEIMRETATIFMLLTLAYVTSDKWKERLAYFLLSFGVWDIFYYFWLAICNGWPRSLMDTDVLFLIPVPWVSPVIVPISISVVMILTALWLIEKTPVKK
jgi:hypothetical protein